MSAQPLASTPATHEPVPGANSPFLWGRVLQMEADGQVLVQVGDLAQCAAVSTHIPGLVAGQAVLLAASPPIQKGASDNLPLVVAAWPAPGAPICPPWQFDRASGTLALSATHLELSAVNSVLLQCADARMQFTRDGMVETRGQGIVSAAIETHRIEGGSIELN